MRNPYDVLGVPTSADADAIKKKGLKRGFMDFALFTKIIDDLAGEYHKRFMLHYNFPPFSVGEVKFLRGPGRREIGHGALAERALIPVLPSAEEFPYVIRLVSECVTSNGSTSMASIG